MRRGWSAAIVAFGMIAMFFIGYTRGRWSQIDAYQKMFDAWKKEQANECVCGDTQTCSFGPGVVGEQQCRTDAVMSNRWSRCEPVE